MLILTPTLMISCLIIAILLYFFINAIDDARKWLNVILALLITPLAYFYIWYPISTIFFPYHHHKQFDAENWKEKPGLRYEMIDNMIETHVLEDKTQQEVIELLGTPQWLSWDDAKKDFDPNKWNYGVGVLPGAFRSIKEDVAIDFENGKVLKVLLTQSEFDPGKKEDASSNKKLDSLNTRFKK